MLLKNSQRQSTLVPVSRSADVGCDADSRDADGCRAHIPISLCAFFSASICGDTTQMMASSDMTATL